jgi:hypothetical protein
MELYPQPTLRVFDENLQPLVNVKLPNNFVNPVAAVCPTEQAIFALTGDGTRDAGSVLKYDSNGSYVGTTSGPHGVDLIVDEDRQVVWTVGKHLLRATTDLSNEQQFHTFGWAGESLDLDANGGVWVAELAYDSPTGIDQLVHFDVDGKIISGDTLPGAFTSVRVDRNSGLVWVTTINEVAYRDVDGQLKTVPVLPYQQIWLAAEPDPLDGSRAWVADYTGQVFHIDTNGTIIQSLGGGAIHKSQMWLATMLRAP